MEHSSGYSIPPFVEFSLETVIAQVEHLRELVDALSELGSSTERFVGATNSESLQ